MVVYVCFVPILIHKRKQTFHITLKGNELLHPVNPQELCQLHAIKKKLECLFENGEKML